MFTRIGSLTIMLCVLTSSAAALQSDSCGSVMKLSQHDGGGRVRIDAKNVSGKPIVGYVVVDAPTSPKDSHTHSLRGVFTDANLMQPRSSMKLGTFAKRDINGVFSVDYVRLSDGTTCGKAESNDAKSLSDSLKTQ